MTIRVVVMSAGLIAGFLVVIGSVTLMIAVAYTDLHERMKAKVRSIVRRTLR